MPRSRSTAEASSLEPLSTSARHHACPASRAVGLACAAPCMPRPRPHLRHPVVKGGTHIELIACRRRATPDQARHQRRQRPPPLVADLLAPVIACGCLGSRSLCDNAHVQRLADGSRRRCRERGPRNRTLRRRRRAELRSRFGQDRVVTVGDRVGGTSRPKLADKGSREGIAAAGSQRRRTCARSTNSGGHCSCQRLQSLSHTT